MNDEDKTQIINQGSGDSGGGDTEATMVAPPPNPEPRDKPKQKLGKYEILSIAGQGAMGVVYRAFDPTLERVVAIKTVKKDLLDANTRDEILARFRREATTTGRLPHPGIISVYDYDESEDQAFIAMEFVEGEELEDIIRRGDRLHPNRIAGIMEQLLSALEFAHSKGVVHRDIKPSNIILMQDGTVKVADFGIARVDSSSLTISGSVLGTPSFMSPEQCQGQPVDPRSDLFSVGAVFYYLVTGEKPFPGDNPITIMQRVVNQDPDIPSQLNTTLPRFYDGIILKALAKRPDERFQNAREFINALFAPDSTTDATIAVSRKHVGQYAAGNNAAGGQAAPATGAGQEKSGGSKGTMIGLLVVLLAAAGGGGFWYMQQQEKAPGPASTVVTPPPVVAQPRPEPQPAPAPAVAPRQEPVRPEPARQVSAPPPVEPARPAPEPAQAAEPPAVTSTLIEPAAPEPAARPPEPEPTPVIAQPQPAPLPEPAPKPQPVEPPKPAMQVSLSTAQGDNPTLKMGDTLSVEARSSQPGYAYCFYQDYQGTTMRIRPNRFSADNRVGPDRVLRLPGPNDQFEIVMEQARAVEQMLCAISAEPLDPGISVLAAEDLSPLGISILEIENSLRNASNIDLEFKAIKVTVR